MIWKSVLVCGAITFVEVTTSLGHLIFDEQLFQALCLATQGGSYMSFVDSQETCMPFYGDLCW